jgi:uncharacterized membrane protein YukC
MLLWMISNKKIKKKKHYIFNDKINIWIKLIVTFYLGLVIILLLLLLFIWLIYMIYLCYLINSWIVS